MTLSGYRVERVLPLLMLMLIAVNSRAELPARIDEPSLVVYKSQRRMELLSKGQVVKIYPIGLGLDPISLKRRQGDRATPEGEYLVCGKLPNSSYHKALILNYPNAQDAARGLNEGLISKREHAAIVQAIRENRCPSFATKLGGEIEIHGAGSQTDWTWGCVALENLDIDELYKALPKGTRVHIKP